MFLNSSSYNTNDQPGQKGQPFLPLYSYELTIQPYSYKDSGTYLCIMSYTLKEGGRKEVAAETLVDFGKLSDDDDDHHHHRRLHHHQHHRYGSNTYYHCY